MTRTGAEPATFHPRSHPEVPVVIALAVLGSACAGLWWSGAVAPRVTAEVRSIADTRTGAVPGTIAIVIENHGPLGVELRQVGVSVSGGAPVEVLGVRISGRDIGPGARLGAGQAARIDVDYVFDCRGAAGIGADPAVWVRVRGVLGPTHTQQASTLALQRERSGGNDSRDPGPLLCPFAVP